MGRSATCFFPALWKLRAAWQYKESPGPGGRHILMAIIYDRGRYPRQPANKKCRGCHGDVPKGRSSWCSNACYNRYEPKRVRHFCRERDRCVCFHCGKDTEKIRLRFEHARQWREPSQYQFFDGAVFNRDGYDRAFAIALRHERRWRAAAEKRRKQMIVAGWPYHTCRDWWEMDHIIPYSEGGLTVLENVRTLCVVCHKKRTKKWHAERKKEQLL